MKTQLLVCFVVLGILSASKSADAKTITRHKRITAGGPLRSSVTLNRRSAATPVSTRHASATALDSVTKLLRLKLYLDPYDWDDIAIAFNAGASPAYDPNEDARYMPGFGAAEGLACFSSDGVELSVNFLPLPTQSPDIIRLDVEAQNSGPITLKRTELDSLPKAYHILLVDKYKKDTVDLRTDSNYVFNINKADTNTFGTSRFVVVVSKDSTEQVHLVNFKASKENETAEISWATQNEENYTHFTIERSSDGGTTFDVIDTLASNGQGTYNFTDKAPPKTLDDYRLRVTALNGIITYSNIIPLSFTDDSLASTTSAISLYPNPTNGLIKLAIGASSNPSVQPVQLAVQSLAGPAISTGNVVAYNIHIINISGITVKSAMVSGPTWQDNVASLSPGTYVITVVEHNSNKLVGRSTFVKL